MIRKDIIAPHFGHQGLLIRSTNIAYSPLSRNDCSTLSLVEARTIGIALRKSFVRKVTDVCSVITNREFLMRAQNTAQSATYWLSGRDTEK